MTTTATPGRELLACPFCGGPAIFERPGNTRQSCIIKCEDCGCKLETGEVFHQGTAWNTRLAAKPADKGRDISALPGELALIQIAMDTLRHIAGYSPVSQPVLIARDTLKKIEALTFTSEPVRALSTTGEPKR